VPIRPDPPIRRSSGILSGPIDAPPAVKLAKVYPLVHAVVGMALSHRASGFSGTLIRIEGGGVELRGQTGQERVFRLAPGAFAVDRKAVSLVRPPNEAAPSTSSITASGSVAVRGVPARVGRGGRAPPASGSRASTTPPWSNGCGGTTCG
jgi:hypothetical protein